MKKILVLLASVLLIFVVTSCSQAHKEDGDVGYDETTLAETTADYASSPAIAQNEKDAGASDQSGYKGDANSSDVKEIISEQRKLIKNGTIAFETKDIGDTKARIDRAVVAHKAYVSNEQVFEEYERTNHMLVIRVDSKNFDKLVNDICNGVEKFDTKTIDVNDVTEEYLDVQARLKTKKELEARYLELLKKATRVGEILEIEQQISYLRSEIESTEGRLRYMNDRIDFSTLTVTFYKKSDTRKTGFGELFAKGFMNGINALIWFFVGLVNIWPFILIVLVTIWLIRRHIRRKRNKKQQAQ